MITIYLDMDGVVCNFEEKFAPLKPAGVKYDKAIFGKAVMEGKIFEDLNWMPNGKKLISHVRSIPGIKVEMLTSVGTQLAEQGAEAARQKKVWLQKHGIDFHPNFVKMFLEKKKWAHSHAILIDDRVDCALPFTEAGGHGILYDDKHIDKALATLDSIVLQLKAIDAKTKG
jgi:hypothetical protein